MALRLRPPKAFRGSVGGDPPADDDAIVLRALITPAAFEPLYLRYVDAIQGYCYRRLRERETAEDLTSLIFHKALKQLHLYHGGSFKAWLFTIANNTVKDAVRAGQIRRLTVPIGPDDDWPDPAPGPEALAMDDVDRQRLHQAIDRLPDEWQQVVHLRQGTFSCAEAAEIIGNGRTEAWVRQIHHRAFLKLRELLRGDDQTKGGGS